MSNRITVNYIDRDKIITADINMLDIRKIENVAISKLAQATINLCGVKLETLESKEEIKKLMKEKI